MKQELMKAIVCTKYGSLNVLKLKGVEKPIPKYNEVLVKVYAASVNYNNLLFVKGEPFVGRQFTGFYEGAYWTGKVKPIIDRCY
jgi:NADPH:quinone reductase-like Zn-dependent oxidoreductase